MNNQNSIESILISSGRPVRLSEIKKLLNSQSIDLELSEIRVAIRELEERYLNTSLEVVEVASGFRVQVKSEFSNLLYPIWNDANSKTSKALLETIAIIAYKQPVTRGDIEEIRGVTVSSNIIRNLLERDWIKITGYRDVPGRPALLETTKTFLDDLNLKSLSQLPLLPALAELKLETIQTEQTDLSQTG
ncbi:MAG: SMC-Scp complex subunit ScpB [Gammaproteobacteria bacterium]